ncbi:MAG: flavin reductase family protein [Bacteroidales bacterium]|nr:flavin reductase family protein [Bacteroidales bacterium]MBN2757823.1 flavin reductase family protein [Bacteroidales bacterium]
MSKVNWNPGTLIYPLPAVMVSMGNSVSEHNIITISWTGTINTNPPMCYISIRPGRHSYEILKRNMEFVINLTTQELAHAADWCGVKSGKNLNKFNEMNLHTEKAQVVNAPLIKESPLNIECKVNRIIPLGSHDMFIAEVVAVSADEKFINSETGSFELNRAGLISYAHGFYYKQGTEIGKFGFSVNAKNRWRKTDKNKQK